MYDLATLDCLDFSLPKFQRNKLHEQYAKGDSIYAMYAGYSEPRTGVYFNKRLLNDAGIDPETIYDMQADGTWTWDAFEEMMAAVQRDIDNDGVIDIYGLTLNEGNMTTIAVFSNNGSYIGKNDDGYFYNLESPETLEALEWTVDMFTKYDLPDPEGAEWDYYKEAFINGQAAFMVEDEYAGTPGNFLQDMEDEVEGLKTRIANAEADIADIEKKQAELRHAIQEAGLLIEKYSKQQDNVKNNREYESLGKEIEYQSLEQQVCEKRIGECERALAEKRALIDDTKARLAIFEANLEEKKKELEVIIEETAAAEEKFQAEKAELEKKIDERMLVAYNRVRGAAKNHLAVVTIEREACGGCFNQIPPQRKLDIIQGKKIIVCEYCGRILVNPEYKNDYKTEEA